MKKHLASAWATLFLIASAHAVDPTAVIATPGVSFAEYSSPTPVGQGEIDTNTLFYIDEKVGTLGKGWYVFFDPQGPGDVSATLTFETNIIDVYYIKGTLDSSNAAYGAAGITYGSSPLMGLELNSDAFSFVGNVLTIDWHAIDPGDHIRVVTVAPRDVPVVPEPETYALLMAGLIAVGFITRRRGRRA